MVKLTGTHDDHHKVISVFGVVCISYGLARWQIVPEVLSQQDAYFMKFFAAHPSGSTNQITTQEINHLHKGVMMSGGMYPGWPQAIGPCAVGLVLFAISYYFSQKKRAIGSVKKQS